MYVYIAYMDKLHFKFQNQECCSSSKRKEHLSVKDIRVFLSFSFSFVILGFFTSQILWLSKTNKKIFNSQPSFKTETHFKEAHVIPLLVNLRGKEGPQLVRVNVYITLKESSFEKESLFQNNKLEKHLLFALSGQPLAHLSQRKTQFEKQIQSQLNTFLAKNLINRVHIQTKKLN